MEIKLYNTLTRKKEIFKPLKKKEVGLYTCGPTVYDFAHIGNLRTYVFEDILRRALEYNGLEVKHVMNITDVGHLSSDADSGEDKMAKALKREGKELNEKSMLALADFYTQAFKKDIRLLNIQEPKTWCKATEYIKEQIKLVEKLVANNYAYETDSAIYFDTSKLADYGKLAKLDMAGMQTGVSADKKTDKKNPADFALWLKLTGENKNHIMNWDSPWGKGFPGWHIECSAMSMAHLGDNFDIHCGGVDHISVHHTNERAQNIGASGHEVVHFWMHSEFLVMKKEKMAKSAGNFLTLSVLIEKGFHPLAYRYFCLGAHYRSTLTFSWKAIEGAQSALQNLQEKILNIKTQMPNAKSKLQISNINGYQKKFLSAINDDLNMPQALAVVWELIKDENVESEEKYATLLDFDRVLGLGLDKIEKIEIPIEVKKLAEKREKYRQEKDFEQADEIRKQVGALGFEIEDTDNGPKMSRKN